MQWGLCISHAVVAALLSLNLVVEHYLQRPLLDNSPCLPVDVLRSALLSIGIHCTLFSISAISALPQ